MLEDNRAAQPVFEEYKQTYTVLTMLLSCPNAVIKMRISTGGELAPPGIFPGG